PHILSNITGVADSASPPPPPPPLTPPTHPLQPPTSVPFPCPPITWMLASPPHTHTHTHTHTHKQTNNQTNLPFPFPPAYTASPDTERVKAEWWRVWWLIPGARHILHFLHSCPCPRPGEAG